jgi:hypothetical protein
MFLNASHCTLVLSTTGGKRLTPQLTVWCLLTRPLLVVHDHAVGGREDDLGLGRHDMARVQGELEPTQQNKQGHLGKTKGARYRANFNSGCACSDGAEREGGCKSLSS